MPPPVADPVRAAAPIEHVVESFVPVAAEPGRIPSRPERRPLTRETILQLVMHPQENPAATIALCLGLASIFLPLLAVPSILLAVSNLKRLAHRPWLQGRARSYGGIVASVILAPISLAIWLPLIFGIG